MPKTFFITLIYVNFISSFLPTSSSANPMTVFLKYTQNLTNVATPTFVRSAITSVWQLPPDCIATKWPEWSFLSVIYIMPLFCLTYFNGFLFFSEWKSNSLLVTKENSPNFWANSFYPSSPFDWSNEVIYEVTFLLLLTKPLERKSNDINGR